MDYGQNKPPICARVSGPEYQYMNSHGDTWYTTWAEIDRQHLLVDATTGEVKAAVFEAWNEVFQPVNEELT
jgi:hypothetical protein